MIVRPLASAAREKEKTVVFTGALLDQHRKNAVTFLSRELKGTKESDNIGAEIAGSNRLSQSCNQKQNPCTCVCQTISFSATMMY